MVDDADAVPAGFLPEEPADGGGASLYPMYFGASCAFLALHLLSGSRAPDLDAPRRSRLGEALLRGGSRLLGLLVWHAQLGLEELREGRRRAEMEVADLKRLRAEDARANEKVVGIFAAHEQSWLADRKKLRLQIQALLTQFQMLDAKREAAMAESNGKIEEKDALIRRKDEELEEAAKRRAGLEERLRSAEAAERESREEAKKQAQDHAAELWKHKAAYVELVSGQRQLEVEMGRALRQAEAARRELEEAMEQKEEATAAAEGLSQDLARVRKDAEQKDKILSAMLRKSKMDTAERQMLTKEVKLAKARRKQAELEVERLRGLSGPRPKKGYSSEDKGGAAPSKVGGAAGFRSRTLADYSEAESIHEGFYDRRATPDDQGDARACALRRCSSENSSEGEIGIGHLQEWVRAETEKYASVLQQRHCADVEAFTEQMRQKDEKLETYRWRLLSMELEAKRLQSHIEGLEGNLSRLGEETIGLEALLLDKEKEVKYLKEQIDLHTQFCSRPSAMDAVKEVGIPSSEESPSVEDDPDAIDEVKKVLQFEAPASENSHPRVEEKEEPPTIGVLTTSAASSPLLPNHQFEGIFLIGSSSPVDEEKEVNVDTGQTAAVQTTPRPEEAGTEVADQVEISASGSSSVCEGSPWKMDLHALGISYKIKRLKQQLLVLEKLAAAQALKQLPGNEHKQQLKGFLLVMSLLNKQVKRYQSLEEKADDLCKRMHEIEREGRGRRSCQGRTKEQTAALQGFLEETFQLQRYIVATGQKLTEVQSRIARTFVGGGGSEGGLKDSPEFNVGRFAAIVRGLFREIQRGLEVRIARIIGNLEGTLASDGILHMRIHD